MSTDDCDTSEAVAQAKALLDQLSHRMAKAFEEVGNEAAVVLIRAIEKNLNATADDLRIAWKTELSAPVDEKIIEMAPLMASLFGEEWHVVCLHRHLLVHNDVCRGDGDTRENCPLFGDDLEDVEDYWERTFDEFDAKRANEEAAARAWLDRQAKKVA